MSMEDKDRLWDVAWEHPDDEVANAAFQEWFEKYGADWMLEVEPQEPPQIPSPPRKPALPDKSITQMKMEIG